MRFRPVFNLVTHRKCGNTKKTTSKSCIEQNVFKIIDYIRFRASVGKKLSRNLFPYGNVINVINTSKWNQNPGGDGNLKNLNLTVNLKYLKVTLPFS